MQAADELIKNDGIVVNADGLLSLEGKMSMNLIKQYVKNVIFYILDENKDLLNKNDENAKMKEEAFMRLSQDISMVDDDHLDLTLQQEEMFLKQYMTLLKQD